MYLEGPLCYLELNFGLQTHSALVTNFKKLLYTVANPARGLLNREKRTNRGSLAVNPPPPTLLERCDSVIV